MKRLLLFSLLLVPLTASAQPEITLPTTVSARSTAMGRTSILSADGGSAIFSNPSLLASLHQMEISGGGRTLFGVAIASDDQDVETGTFPVHAKLDHFSFAAPIALADSSMQLAFGIGYHTYYDFGFNLKFEDSQDAFSYASKGGLDMISPAVAIGFQDRFFAGLSYHTSVNSRIVEEFEAFDSIDEIYTRGSFFMMGFLARFSPAFSIGGMYRSGFDWELQASNSDKIEWHHPSVWGLGASLFFSDSWQMVGEYHSRPFSSYDLNGFQNALGVDDGYSIRLGFEKRGDIPFRFGFFREALPQGDLVAIDASSLVYLKNEPKHLYGATVGFGVPVGGVRINMAWEASYWQQEVIEDIKQAQLFSRFRASARYRFN